MTIEVVRTPPADARPPASPPPGPAGPASVGRARAARGGPDRLSIALFSLALFLVLLALLAQQLQSAGAVKAPGYILVRKVYRTRVIKTIIGPGPVSVSQSVASSGSVSAPPVISTHTS